MQTLVLVPGLGSDAAVWKRTINELNGRVQTMVGNTLEDDSVAGMAQRILDQAPERFALAGVSMGGMVAMQMVSMAPQRIVCLALVDTTARPDSLYRKLYRRAANLAVAAADFKRLSRFSLRSLVHPSASAEVRTALVEMSLRVGAKTYRRQTRAVLHRPDYRPTLARISVPTVIIVGRQDSMTPVEQSQEIHTLIRGSVLQIIEECGHLPPIEQPKAVADTLLGFLGEDMIFDCGGAISEASRSI